MDAARTIDFYWRPGCFFCMSLERSLVSSGFEFNKRNIWEDSAAAAYVRSVAGGNETVPTVAVGDVALVNPRSEEVIAVVRSEAPHLLPAGL